MGKKLLEEQSLVRNVFDVIRPVSPHTVRLLLRPKLAIATVGQRCGMGHAIERAGFDFDQTDAVTDLLNDVAPCLTAADEKGGLEENDAVRSKGFHRALEIRS